MSLCVCRHKVTLKTITRACILQCKEYKGCTHVITRLTINHCEVKQVNLLSCFLHHGVLVKKMPPTRFTNDYCESCESFHPTDVSLQRLAPSRIELDRGGEERITTSRSEGLEIRTPRGSNIQHVASLEQSYRAHLIRMYLIRE